ncbi:hypothetical protein PYS58_08515 [Chryseobacterium indologenes]|uniref:hypothetical protein n=1 Tax=Chryseobacterium indologenes TaxID=253 RepID=UPI0023E7992D|nr:hypothetical protein [Chryseobacterium indologenes]WET51172.1 hypothetical protein PYS58_08515 [Chryseobacterium indologenes]
MKLLFFILLLAVINLNAQKKIIIPVINDDKEKYDTDFFSKEIRKNVKDSIYITERENQFYVNDKNGKSLISYTRSYKTDGFSGYDYSQNSLFGVYRLFYPNNILKEKGIMCWFGFKIGKWYHYDEHGKLVSVENYDKGFDFTYLMIFNYCKKNKIPLEKIEWGLRTSIFKKVKENTFVWVISYFGISDFDKGKKVEKVVQLDGKTGKVIEKSEYPLPVDGETLIKK